MDRIQEIISAFSNLAGIIKILILSIPLWIYGYIYIKVQIRKMRNFRREVYLVKTSEGKPLTSEKRALEDLDLFRVNKDICNISTGLNELQSLKDHSIWVIGYDPSFTQYKDLVELAKNKKIPIVIYARQGEIQTPQHWDIFNSYIKCDVANTHSRVAILIYNLMAIA